MPASQDPQPPNTNPGPCGRQPPGDGLWLIAADRGGTFTDCCATDPDGRRHRVKLLSSGRLRTSAKLNGTHALALETHADYPVDFFKNWNASLFLPDPPHSNGISNRTSIAASWSGVAIHSANGVLTFPNSLPASLPAGCFLELDTGEPAPITGARLLTRTPPGQPFPPHRFRLATTLATNALLENQGARAAFFVTRGFRDLLVIRDQRRPDLFALQHHRDPPLHHHTIEVDERLDAAGKVLTSFNAAALTLQAEALVREGVRTAAVALAHSDLNPAHEIAVRDVLAAAGFSTISLSSELSPQVRLLPRASTAVVDAALAPVIHGFVKNVRRALGPECRQFHCLTSAGGLADPDNFHAKDSLLSGPAGGVAGSAAAAKKAASGLAAIHAAEAGAADFLTKTDCPSPARILTLDMGGTSTDVARWEGHFLYQFEQKLGQSTILAPSLRIETVAAGGGSICSVVAGALTVGPRSAGADPGPACYGRGGPLTLTDVNLLLGRLDPARASIPLLTAPAREALTDLKKAMREQDLPLPADDHALLTGLLQIAIGRMAEALRSISVRDGCDPTGYTLLAFGGAGPQHACAIAEELGISQILIPADAGLLSAAGAAASRPERFGQRQLLRPLGDAEWLVDVLTNLESETLTTFPGSGALIHQRLADLRLQGQETSLTINFDSPGELPAAFAERFQQLYGYPPPPHRGVEIVSLRVMAAPPEAPVEPETFPRTPTHPAPDRPLVIQDHFSTLILEPGWTATSGAHNAWLLRRAPHSASADRISPPSHSPAAT
ncbi:MAG: 5-oxoprolinase, partial [Verrucomicrobiales bacterium]|nr:5-oxoprolinase [Verrucomicrobiales bacterium]